MSKCKYGMQKPVQNVLQQCINGFKRMKKGGIGVANECVQQACEMALKYINELEAKLADSKPVKHGHWIDKPYPNYPAHDIRYCSECGWNIHKSKLRNSDLNWNHCPNCGAMMDGGDENAN